MADQQPQPTMDGMFEPPMTTDMMAEPVVPAGGMMQQQEDFSAKALLEEPNLMAGVAAPTAAPLFSGIGGLGAAPSLTTPGTFATPMTTAFPGATSMSTGMPGMGAAQTMPFGGAAMQSASMSTGMGMTPYGVYPGVSSMRVG